jgi:hypothetical protein
VDAHRADVGHDPDLDGAGFEMQAGLQHAAG